MHLNNFDLIELMPNIFTNSFIYYKQDSFKIEFVDYSNYSNKMSKILDQLIKRLVVQVRGHDRSVLDSYTQFVQIAANELGVELKEIKEPTRFIERWTLLKSRFSNRKHMRQYEMRTYFREYEFERLTGSTSDTLLEYIQRNLPEGVAMHVHSTKSVQLPDFILKDLKNNASNSSINK